MPAVQDSTKTEAETKVRYRKVPGFPGYRVGDDGSVWTRRKRGRGGYRHSDWRKIKQHRSRGGYLRVRLTSSPRESRCYAVHRLVLGAFVGPCPDGMECRHLNGIKTDNCLVNLTWGTRVENAADKKRHGTAADVSGESNPRARLTRGVVVEIRAALASGILAKTLAERFGVKLSTIFNVGYGKTWKHVGGPVVKHGIARGEGCGFARLTPDQVVEIRAAYAGGSSRADLASRYKVTPSNVAAICSRKSWKHIA